VRPARHAVVGWAAVIWAGRLPALALFAIIFLDAGRFLGRCRSIAPATYAKAGAADAAVVAGARETKKQLALPERDRQVAVAPTFLNCASGIL